MRLTCPRCAAQYEIADSAIPPAGREVECSSCGQIWHQPAPGQATTGAEAGTAPAHAGFDPSARPALNQPLDESVLSILREETARELRARQGGDQPDTGAAPADEAGGDHIPATEAAAGAGAEGVAAPPPPPAPTQPPAAPAGAAADAEPGEKARQDGATGMAKPTAPDLPAPGTDEPAHDTTGSETAAQQPRDPKRPALPHLPDAVELAATLTRPGPHRPVPAQSPPAVPPETRPLIAEASPPPPPEPAPSAPVTLPMPAPPPGRGGYALGFGLAVTLALALVAAYALAPSPEPGTEAGPLASLKQEIDRGRLWLHDRIAGEKP